MYNVKVYVTYKESILDPQGEAVRGAVHRMGFDEIEDIRIGYSWTISSESVQIVEFTPTWYIKKNGTWKTLAELKAEKSQTEPANGPTTTGGDADGF